MITPDPFDIAGEGGEVWSVDVSDFVGGGVDIDGDEVVVTDVEASDIGDGGRSESIDRGVVLLSRFFVMIPSACFNLPCRISASTFSSEYSSLTRWFSILRASRSCSPILISSSIKTPRSIDTLYFDSRSSNDDVWFRACLSKSSFWTSISRTLNCSVRFVSLSVVISFCSVACALLASAFACLYFSYIDQSANVLPNI